MYRWAREESKRQPTKRGEQHQKPAPGARLLVQYMFPARCRWWGSGARTGGAGRQAWWGPAQHTGVRRVRGRAPAPKGPHGLRVPLRACEPHGRHSQPRPACAGLGDPHPPLTASRPPREEATPAGGAAHAEPALPAAWERALLLQMATSQVGVQCYSPRHTGSGQDDVPGLGGRSASQAKPHGHWP